MRLPRTTRAQMSSPRKERKSVIRASRRASSSRTAGDQRGAGPPLVSFAVARAASRTRLCAASTAARGWLWSANVSVYAWPAITYVRVIPILVGALQTGQKFFTVMGVVYHIPSRNPEWRGPLACPARAASGLAAATADNADAGHCPGEYHRDG